jgi:hypothetical protein
MKEQTGGGPSRGSSSERSRFSPAEMVRTGPYRRSSTRLSQIEPVEPAIKKMW